MFWFSSGQIRLASAYYWLNLNTRARLLKKPDTRQSKSLNHYELVVDYERLMFLNSYLL